MKVEELTRPVFTLILDTLRLLLAEIYLKAIVREHIPWEIAKVHFQVFQTRIQLVLLYWVILLVSYF